MRQGAQGRCYGKTQRDGMGKKMGRGFRMGEKINTELQRIAGRDKKAFFNNIA